MAPTSKTLNDDHKHGVRFSKTESKSEQVENLSFHTQFTNRIGIQFRKCHKIRVFEFKFFLKMLHSNV